MKLFSELLESLIYTSSRNAKMMLLKNYFEKAADPDRGIALAALTGTLQLPNVTPAIIRKLMSERADPVLFSWSYDFVGDLAETTALMWPSNAKSSAWPELKDVYNALMSAKKKEVPDLISNWLDAMDENGRWALLKLMGGGLRVGVSARLAKSSLAKFGDVEVAEIEEVWHALEVPFEELFSWLEGVIPRPSMDHRAVFRPLMLANPVSEKELLKIKPSDYALEWKWDGIRVQLAANAEERKLFSRTGDDISNSFPEIIEASKFNGVLDGELLVIKDKKVAPFNDLQQRLNRKKISDKLILDFPCHVRLYDILFDGEEDLRAHSFKYRRLRLERFVEEKKLERMDLSELVDFKIYRNLSDLHATCREYGLEGLMLKPWESLYVAGRPKPGWFKWKRNPLIIDTVMMYAQRGHGRRSSFYSDFTFGVWWLHEQKTELVPVAKAYFGFTDGELKDLDKWVRDNTVQRYGPVRQVTIGLVIELAFDSIHRSKRHKSGVAMRFPRVHRIRWDKPAEEADWLESLETFIE